MNFQIDRTSVLPKEFHYFSRIPDPKFHLFPSICLIFMLQNSTLQNIYLFFNGGCLWPSSQNVTEDFQYD